MGGWDPVATNFNLYTVVIGAQTLHATGYAMGLQRDGAESAALAFLGDGATSQGEVNEAMIFAVVVRRAGGLLLPEQPVRDQRADRAAVPRSAVPPGRRLRLPRRAGRRQRRPRRPGGHPGGAGRGPRGPGPHLHRGLHLPDGRAHHLRRPDPLPDGQRARGVEAARPDRPAQGVPVPLGQGRRRLLRRRRRRGRRAGRPAAQGHAGDGRPGRHRDVRPRLRRADPRAGRSAEPRQRARSIVAYHAQLRAAPSARR